MMIHLYDRITKKGGVLNYREKGILQVLHARRDETRTIGRAGNSSGERKLKWNKDREETGTHASCHTIILTA